MSKNKSINQENQSANNTSSKSGARASGFKYGKKPSRWQVIALVCLLTLGVAGAGGLKYLEDTRSKTRSSQQSTMTEDAPEENSRPNSDLIRAEAEPATNLPAAPPPVAKEYVYAGGSRLLAVEEPAPITTAAKVTIGGRLTKQNGHRVKDSEITMTDERGAVRTTASSNTGKYSFTNVEVGKTYVLTVKDKHLTFSPPTRVANVMEETLDLDFVGDK